MLKPEPGQIYAIDTTILASKSDLKLSDVSLINLSELFNAKTPESFLSFENVGNNLYFIGTKTSPSKPKKLARLSTQNTNILKLHAASPHVAINRDSNGHNKSRELKPKVQTLTNKRIRNDSIDPINKPYSHLVNNKERASVVIAEHIRSRQLTRLQKQVDGTSDLVNIYKVSTRSKVIRL